MMVSIDRVEDTRDTNVDGIIRATREAFENRRESEVVAGKEEGIKYKMGEESIETRSM